MSFRTVPVPVIVLALVFLGAELGPARVEAEAPNPSPGPTAIPTPTPTPTAIPIPIPAPSATPAADPEQALRRVAGILDYIGGDYQGAVSPDGKVLDEGEYAEQRSLAGDADALAVQAALPADGDLRRLLAEISAALTAKAPPARIDELCARGRTFSCRRGSRLRASKARACTRPTAARPVTV